MLKQLRRLIFYASVALAAMAVLDQLKRPAGERTWHGSVLRVPYDLRPPSFQRTRDAWWNPHDPRLFTPRDFGVGWSLNLARLLQLISGPAKNDGDG